MREAAPVRGASHRFLQVAVTASLLFWWGTNAVADPETRRTSTLAWVRLPGAEACIGTLELAQAVEARLGRWVFAPVSQADLAVEGRIEPRGSGFVASLSVGDREGKTLGTRQLESSKPDCRSMDRALVFVTSLLIDPDAFPESRADAEPAVEPAPVPTSSAAPSGPSGDEVSLWSAIDLSGTLSVGPLPGPSPGVAIGFGLGQDEGFQGRFVGQFGYGSAETVRGSSASLTQLSLGLGLCYSRRVISPSSLELCVGPELGATLAAADALSGPQDRTALWFAGAFGLRTHFVLAGALLLHVAAELVVPFRRDRFTYMDGAGASQVLFEPSAVGFRAALGFGYRVSP